MNDLYRNELCIWLNYFQPSVKLVEKRRVGSRVKRIYDNPQTPLDRLISLGAVEVHTAAQLRAQRDAINPFELAARIEHKIAAILQIPVHGPTQRPGKRFEGTLSAAHARRRAEEQAATVRKYVAR